MSDDTEACQDAVWGRLNDSGTRLSTFGGQSRNAQNDDEMLLNEGTEEDREG